MVRATIPLMSVGNGSVRSGISHTTIQAHESFSPEEGLRRARTQILIAMPAIIDAIIEQAQAGSCQHAKFLMEFAHEEPIEETTDSAVDPDEESLASLLLRELRETEAED